MLKRFCCFYRCVGKEVALLALRRVVFVGRGMPNVPLAGRLKIVFNKCGWEKNKKHRDGIECLLTRCPFIISFLCLWSPVKMVYFFLFLSLVCLSCRCLNTLVANGPALGAVADFGAQNCQYTTKVDAR